MTASVRVDTPVDQRTRCLRANVVRRLAHIGRTTVFFWSLPRAPCHVIRDDCAMAGGGTADMAWSVGATILIVDDDNDVREFAVQVFEDDGFAVLAASGGAEALEILRSNPQIALLFTD